MTAIPRISPSGPPLIITPPSTGFEPIFRQLWLDTTKDPGGNGSIGAPYNAWANALAPLQASGAGPWLINIAQGLDASGTPIPDIGAGGHDIGFVKLSGNVVLTGLVVGAQSNGLVVIDFEDITVTGLSLAPNTTTLTGERSSLSGLVQASGAVFGFSNLINCTIDSVALSSWTLSMKGGTVDNSISVFNGFLDDVEFQAAVQFRYANALNLTNCRFQAGAQILCSANQQLNMDLDTWGSLVAAGVTFPDTRPSMTIVPWVPIIGQIAVVGTVSIPDNVVTTLDLGVITPLEAQANTACIASFATPVNSHIVIVGAFVDASRHINVLVVTYSPTPVDLINPTYTISYLPRLT